MPFSLHLPAQVHDFAAGVKAALGGLFHRAAEKAAELRGRVQPVIDKLLGGFNWLPPEKRRLVLIALMGGIAALLLIFIGILIMAKAERPQSAPSREVVVRQGPIPPDEVFLPDEPDFIPGVILEREQRIMWTIDDAEPLWQDPLKNGEEPWRNRIEKAIDEIMESVP